MIQVAKLESFPSSFHKNLRAFTQEKNVALSKLAGHHLPPCVSRLPSLYISNPLCVLCQQISRNVIKKQ